MSWRSEVSKSQHFNTGVPLGSMPGPLLSSIYITSLGSVKHDFFYHCFADDRQLHLSFQPDDPMVSVHISACMTDTLPKIHHNLSIQLGPSTITPSRTAKNLGVVIDDHLKFTDHCQHHPNLQIYPLQH